MSIPASFGPLSATTGKSVNLSMQQLWLTGQVLPAGGRLVIRHIFQSAEEQPLEVIYSFPLPRDAALRSFRISGDGFETHSELKPTGEAVRAYEAGISQGSLAVLARVYGDGMANLTVGNLRPKETVTVHLEILCGVELRDDGFRFRFPFTLLPLYHAHAKTVLVGPGEGELELPPDEFGDMILPRFREDASALHQVGFDVTLAGRSVLDEVGSPSHAVLVKQEGGRRARIALATGHDLPNRDLVLDAHFQLEEPQVFAGHSKDGVGHFAAIVPSSSFGKSAATPRRVVVLLDRSGSMNGKPIEQARKAIDACLGALSEDDSFGLLAFDNAVSAFQPALVRGTREWRDKAHEFLSGIDARGGTELAAGFLQAAAILKDGGGDVLILTDGQVAGTEKILADARSGGVRLHCLGIGSASQDRFLALLARESGGVSRFVTANERVDLAAVELFASIGRPVATGLKAGANIQPEPASQVISGTPVLLFGEGESIELSWDGGRLMLPVEFGDGDIAETVWLLQGSRLITDWESRYPAVNAQLPLEKRKQNRVAGRLLSLSQTYGLASREMSLVAVVRRPGDRAGELPETRVVPVGMAQDVSMDAYFQSMSFASATAFPSLSCAEADLMAAPQFLRAPDASHQPLLRQARFAMRLLKRQAQATETPEDILLDLASRMDADGGSPGKDDEARAAATAIALLAFLSQGHTLTEGAFRRHVARQVSFLESLSTLPDRRREVVAAVIAMVRKGVPVAGEWLTLARASGDHWRDVEALVAAV